MKAKEITAGDAVQVRREVGKPWEPATYLGKIAGMRGWHRVELAGEAVPILIDSMTGLRLDEARSGRTYTTHRIIVPSQRLARVARKS
mgnify:CR=1 FL=1